MSWCLEWSRRRSLSYCLEASNPCSSKKIALVGLPPFFFKTNQSVLLPLMVEFLYLTYHLIDENYKNWPKQNNKIFLKAMKNNSRQKLLGCQHLRMVQRVRCVPTLFLNFKQLFPEGRLQ